MHCPTAAAACFIRSSVGRAFSPILAVPTAMAPEDTRMTSWPIPPDRRAFWPATPYYVD